MVPVYEPQGARAWPESLPTAVLQVYDSRRPMIGAGQERLCGSDVAVHCLGGPGVAHSPCDGLRRGEWRPQDSVRHAAVESAVCCVLPRCRESGAAGVAYASPNSWVVKTSKRLSYELRRNANRNLGRLNDAQFENLPMPRDSKRL